MAKAKKKGAGQTESRFLVWQPPEYHDKLKELKRTTGQSFTYAYQRAMDEYLRRHGIEPPAVPGLG